MYFLLNVVYAIKRLQSKNGTSDLINKLEIVIDDDENYLVQIILMYDNCNNDIKIIENFIRKNILICF